MEVMPTTTMRDQYRLVRDSYTSQGGFANGSYLFQYDREMDYGKRKSMAFYSNFIKPIVDAKVDPVFTKSASRQYDDNDIVDMFLENANNNGVSLQQMVHNATTETVLLGNSFIIMDNFPENEIPDTYQEVLDERKFPYIYAKSVLDVYKYTTDIFGKLEEIIFYNGLYEDGEYDYDVYLYKRFTKGEIEYFILTKNEEGYYKNKVTISITVHELGVVPVVYYNKEVLPFSPYYAMATMARNIYNITSELTDLERSQMFSILLIPSVNSGAEPNEAIIVSSSNALFYDSQATNTPEFISPDSAIMTVQMDHMDKSVSNLIQSADVLGTTAISNGNSANSGIAESYRFFGKMQALLVSSEIGEYYEIEVMNLLARFIGVDFKYEVSYPDSFSPTFAETNAKIDTMFKIADMEISDTVTANMHAGIVSVISEAIDLTDEQKEDMLKSITEVQEII